jgi:hypothetical protein
VKDQRQAGGREYRISSLGSLLVIIGSWLEYADAKRGHTREAADIGLYIL